MDSVTPPIGATAADNAFVWPVIPFPALVGAVGAMSMAAVLLIACRYFDRTRGLLTISLMVVAAFIIAVFASFIYNIPLNPLTEILTGALATSLGAVIAYWMSGSRVGPHERQSDE